MTGRKLSTQKDAQILVHLHKSAVAAHCRHPARNEDCLLHAWALAHQGICWERELLCLDCDSPCGDVRNWPHAELWGRNFHLCVDHLCVDT